MKKEGLLNGKVSLITGAGKGIGKITAERFAEEGSIVYANSRSRGELDEWAESISRKYDARIIPQYYDITDHQRVKDAVMQIRSENQRVDILVNNAGKVTYELLGMISHKNLQELFEVNVFSMIYLIQLVSKIMSRQKSGSIINISSIVGVNGVRGQLAYSASKGAVISLTKSAAKELAADNIRVNAIAPGMVGTERFTKVLNEKFDDKIKTIGMSRLADPAEIADACVFFGSEMSTYITGQILGVDGCTVI
jgi:3-oxoacyl-[acyl-carrier protein] reductase